MPTIPVMRSGRWKEKNMKFNLNDYADTDTVQYVMHCKTEEEAKEFCALLDRAGRHWFNSKPYNRTRWNTYKEDTCYFFNDGHYGCYKTLAAESHRCTILEWSDFRSEERRVGKECR